MSIIDLISLTKIDDLNSLMVWFMVYGSWFKFERICWLLGYPCEYWDYFSKRSTTKYNY